MARSVAKNIDEWLKENQHSIETWSNFAMLHQARWHYARLKDNGTTVSIGAGPSPEAARKDVWENLPNSRR